MRNNSTPPKTPSPLEQTVMEYLWSHGPSTGEQVREGLAEHYPMKEATARTFLRRLEAKGYALHLEDGLS